MIRTCIGRHVDTLIGLRTRMTTSSATVDPIDQYTPARVIFAGICALILTIGIGRFAYTPLLPIMREQAGLSGIGAGWLATINYAGYLGGALLASSIHTLQRKFVLYRIGLLVAVVTTFAMGMTTDFRLWLVLRLLSGWSSTAGMLLGSGLVLNWLLRRGHRPELGIHFAGFGVGMVISGLAVIAMAGHLSWSAQWITLGAMGLLFAVPAWIWLPAPLPAAQSKPLAADPPPSRRWTVLFSFAYFCGGFGYVITATFIVDIVHNMHTHAVPGNWVWIIMGAVAIPSCFIWDRVSDVIGPMRAWSLGFALQTASFALTAYGDSPLSIMAGAVLFGITVIGTVSLTLSIIGRRFPANPAKAMARLTLSYGTAQILGPIVAGYVSHASGDFRGALMVATVVGTIGTLVSLLLSVPRTAR